MADINALIAQGVRPIQIEDPLSRAAKMESLVGARQQQQMNALKMQEYERGVAEQNALRELFRGGLDLESAEGQRRLYETSPTAAQKLIKGRLEARKLEQEARAKEFDTIEKKTNYFRGLLSNVTTPEQGRAWTVAVYTDPDLAPVFSRFGATPQQAAQAVPDDPAAFQSWRNQASVGAARFLELNKPQFFQQELGGERRTIAIPGMGGEATVVPGSQAAVTPPTPAEIQGYNLAVQQGFKGSILDYKREIARAGASQTNISVGTEKKYGERFGGLLAERDAVKLEAAEKAPAIAANADRIVDLIDTGKVFTGSAANVRLQIAKGLNLIGGTDSEKIKNTELLISGLAESTLGAIKSSGLGTGQGFTDKDREFLEKAKAGQISYDAQSLKELARLSRLAAEQSAQVWNTRVKSMPASALEGTGISTKPIVVPKPRGAIPEAAIQFLRAGQGTPEQFDEIFGAGAAAKILGGK